LGNCQSKRGFVRSSLVCCILLYIFQPQKRSLHEMVCY
jgi:hypothetical protein